MVEHDVNLLAGSGVRRAGRSFTVFGLIASAGAFLAASCCVLPFMFLSIGLGGTWLGTLDSLLAYRTELQAVATVALGLGWSIFLWRRLRRPAPDCSGDRCARQRSDRRALLALVLGTFLIVGSWAVWETQGDIRAWLLALRA